MKNIFKFKIIQPHTINNLCVILKFYNNNLKKIFDEK